MLPLKLQKLDRKKTRILLHSCCAPCSCQVIESLHQEKFQFTIFFYNPNVQPQAEYQLRKQENQRYALKLQIPFIDADYDPSNWFSQVRGLEWEPERGRRCSVCFDMRLGHSAGYAAQNHFTHLATTQGISRWKNLSQVNRSGLKATSSYPNLTFLDCNWRKNNALQRKQEITQQEAFYRQQYCGCLYSLRDTNQDKKQKGLPPIPLPPLKNPPKGPSER